MGQRYYLPVVLAFCIAACGGDKEPYAYTVHPTAAGLDKGVLAQALAGGKLPGHLIYKSAGGDFFPIAGTVSHHLLVAPVIDRWFAGLKSLREVGTFIILSPRHYRQGSKQISFSGLPWNAGNGLVEADRECVQELCGALGLPEDREAMHLEHGIGDLLPFIKKYFPRAKIVPIVQDEPLCPLAEIDKLAEALYLVLNKRQDVFLLLSVDFSHHAGPELTGRRDAKTALFLANPTMAGLALVYSDNNKALRVLARLRERLHWQTGFLACHTDSFKFTGGGREDITSYFFCLWGRVPGSQNR